MKSHFRTTLLASCLLGTLAAGCAHRGAGSEQGYEQFKKQEFPLSASQGGTPAAILRVSSYQANGTELNVQPTSKLAASLRSSINHFQATLRATNALPASAKGGPAHIAVDFASTEGMHTGSTALKAGLEAGLTLGLLGNNVTHTYDYHLETTVTVTRADGQSRVYKASNDSTTPWKQQTETGKPAAARSRAEMVNFDAIAAQIKADKSFL